MALVSAVADDSCAQNYFNKAAVLVFQSRLNVRPAQGKKVEAKTNKWVG